MRRVEDGRGCGVGQRAQSRKVEGTARRGADEPRWKRTEPRNKRGEMNRGGWRGRNDGADREEVRGEGVKERKTKLESDSTYSPL